MDKGPPSTGSPPPRDAGAIAVSITIVASVASALLAATAEDAWRSISAQPWTFGVFVLVTLGLQLAVVEIYGKGTLSFAGTGKLAIGFAFGPGAAMLIAAAMGFVLLVRRRGKLHLGVFDAANFALASAAGAAVYHALAAAGWQGIALLGPAFAGGCAFYLVNVGVLSAAMGIAERTNPVAVWRERFRWMTPHYLASGPLALAVIVAYDRVGVVGLIAFALPPALMMVSARMYVARTRASVEEIRQANEELRIANATLAMRNDDLRSLFEFAGGLASHAHDRTALVDYTERSLARLTGGSARVLHERTAGAVDVVAGGTRLASLAVEGENGFDHERWDRLRDAILPQLATALESAELVEHVRKQHLATIAALSRSMEAKDYYTGGHTERVSELAVALAKRLGYTGSELHAIEIGALLHDIGKIGIPERILQKPGPLDEEEWQVMREHPVISEYILSEVDLSPIVLQIARSSHERIDGAGYPDGKAGDAIPLPARIVLVADAFDALTSNRPYRHGRHVAAALDEIRANAGTQFCPTVVEALERVYREEPRVLGGGTLRAVAGAA